MGMDWVVTVLEIGTVIDMVTALLFLAAALRFPREAGEAATAMVRLLGLLFGDGKR